MTNSAVIPQLSDHEISETTCFVLEDPEVNYLTLLLNYLTNFQRQEMPLLVSDRQGHATDRGPFYYTSATNHLLIP